MTPSATPFFKELTKLANLPDYKRHELVLGLVELIDAKDIGMAQLIWS